jgi:hypothetical protein
MVLRQAGGVHSTFINLQHMSVCIAPRSDENRCIIQLNSSNLSEGGGENPQGTNWLFAYVQQTSLLTISSDSTDLKT